MIELQQQAKKRKEPDWIAVSRLLLDAMNYRFPEEMHEANQSELLQILERDFELRTIAESLTDNGYFVEEPLIAIPGPSDQLIVVEGNRRLAALKLIVQPELRNLSPNPEYWEILAGGLKHDISEVPVILYENREELTTHIGFRHIAGILKWNPLSKARFINSIIERKGKESDFAKVAREISSTKPVTRDNYISYRIFLQARDDFEIDTSKLEKTFSIFFRALSDPRLTDFIGLNKDKTPIELKEPISKKKADALEELIGFIHGTDQIEAVITDSRQLSKLGEILDNKDAYNHLKRLRNFDQAYQLSGGEERRLIDNLTKASVYLDYALPDALRHKKSLKVAQWVKRCYETILEIVRHFPEVRSKPEDIH